MTNNRLTRKNFGILILFITLFVSIPVIFYLFREYRDVSTKSNLIHISVKPSFAAPISIYADKVLIGRYNESEIDVQIPTSVKNIKLTAPGYKDLTVQYTGMDMDISLENINGQTTNDLIVDSIQESNEYEFSDQLTIVSSKVYGNNEWIYGILVENNTNRDGERVIVRIDGDKKDIVYSGTDYTILSLVEAGIPQNIAQQIFEDSND